eukprot:jgi/Picsp_1/1890/NSC_05356-R1_protein
MEEKVYYLFDNIKAANNEVLGEFKRHWLMFQNSPSMVQAFKEFVSAVEWDEWWIMTILGIESVLILSLLVFRRSLVFQNVIFFLSMITIYNADKINTLASRHWEAFSRHDYFQANGAFISAVVSAPLMLGMFIILINYILQAVETLVEMKKKQIIHEARKKSSKKKR